MTIKKNVGTRPRPKQRTPEEQRRHRAEQAARAILAGRNREHNWLRIERHLRDCPKQSDFMGLAIPAGAVMRLWPEPPAPTESSRPDTAAA
jgi:hypothetical protein